MKMATARRTSAVTACVDGTRKRAEAIALLSVGGEESSERGGLVRRCARYATSPHGNKISTAIIWKYAASTVLTILVFRPPSAPVGVAMVARPPGEMK